MTYRSIALSLASSALLCLSACAEDLEPSDTLDAGDQTPAERVTTERNSDGTYLTAVDATREDAWTLVDLETGEEVAEGDPWDLGFQRSQIKINGGTSGSGGVQVALIPESTLADVTEVPTDGWLVDDGETFAFGEWYAYDPNTHVLTPHPNVWVIETSDGAHLKLVIDSYYHVAGTPATFGLTWQPMGAP